MVINLFRSLPCVILISTEISISHGKGTSLVLEIQNHKNKNPSNIGLILICMGFLGLFKCMVGPGLFESSADLLAEETVSISNRVNPIFDSAHWMWNWKYTEWYKYGWSRVIQPSIYPNPYLRMIYFRIIYSIEVISDFRLSRYPTYFFVFPEESESPVITASQETFHHANYR